MQKETLELFIQDINDIREYIKYIEIVNNIEGITTSLSNTPLLQLKDHLRSFGVSKKIFEYKSITISLYGILEKHIGIWIKEYLDNLPDIVANYNDLPDRIREDHFTLSVKLLALINENRYAKYNDIDKKKVLSKLNSCIENPLEFQLNSDAFYLQSGNLKHVKVSEAFACLDIKLNDVLKIIGIRPESLLFNNVSNVSNRGDDLFNLIDDLVERRNYIAHGGQIDDILNITEFDEYINFLEAYGKAIFQALSERLIEFEAKHLYKKIEKIHAVYQSGSVLCFELENNKIFLGDSIIVKLIEGGFTKKKVFEIQIEQNKYPNISTTKTIDIGINVGGGISKGQTFFIKRSNI
ncbi:MAE_28990/MAE_18760 family HEPN-like nuclease [Acinetobacter sp.]|jgi:hypothetical protein|uniref:MAE_28990/MAE_18760 family HEPN-like nuclease n=1 Tax=Acinetobacter sp. TaxID=472 RepID=UPI002824460E|nr:MAE_28990/MAE_18760 family HEPN-like nuclease [Acinetobacter sp.]MDR0237116.1 hypothetical protein [Acinetobacter sp.]